MNARDKLDPQMEWWRERERTYRALAEGLRSPEAQAFRRVLLLDEDRCFLQGACGMTEQGAREALEPEYAQAQTRREWG